MVSWWIPRATIRRLLRAFMEHLDVDVPDDVLDKAIDDFIEGRTAVTTDEGGQAGDTSTTSTRTTLHIPNAPVSGEQIVDVLRERETSIEQLAADSTVTVEVDGAQVEVEGTVESRDER